MEGEERGYNEECDWDEQCTSSGRGAYGVLTEGETSSEGETSEETILHTSR